VLVVYSMSERLGHRAAGPVVLCLIIAALGFRTWQRNLDWRDDITLWTLAVQSVPESYKGHAALAQALYQSDPTNSNIDRVIEEAEKSLAILDPLPDALNIVDVYENAGKFYLRKGFLRAQSGPDGRTADSLESVQDYQRAQQLLKRGVSIAKAFDDAFRRCERARGKSDFEIPLTGSPSLYADLSANSMRLGDQKTAFDAALYARLLDPRNPDNYKILGAILTSEGRKEDAAVMLVEGLMTSGDSEFLEQLRRVYRAGVDPKGCAIVQGVSGELLNNSCEPAHNEICGALLDLMLVYRRELRSNLADQTKESAREHGCPAGPLE
jgi:tetratricopeptide (TPR) repeat protein